MKAHIFIIVLPKFWLQIHSTLEGTVENVQVNGIQILLFLTASSLVWPTYLC